VFEERAVVFLFRLLIYIFTVFRPNLLNLDQGLLESLIDWNYFNLDLPEYAENLEYLGKTRAFTSKAKKLMEKTHEKAKSNYPGPVGWEKLTWELVGFAYKSF